MTVAELMRFADHYARSTAHLRAYPSAENEKLVADSRLQLEEALSITSQFGGL